MKRKFAGQGAFWSSKDVHREKQVGNTPDSLHLDFLSESMFYNYHITVK